MLLSGGRVWPDQSSRLQFLWQQHDLFRRVLELLQIVAFDALELGPYHTWCRPLALVAERDVADDRPERVAAEIVGKLAVVDALCFFDRLCHQLHASIRPRWQEIA